VSTNRVSPNSGFAHEARLPRGPGGRCLCRQCGVEVQPPRRTFCSDACVDEWKIKTSPGHVRRKLLERDRGVCVSCGLDCVATAKELERLRDQMSPLSRELRWDRYWPVDGKVFFLRCQEIGLRKPWRGESLWQADHVVPVVEGGGECGLEGFRTLCVPCHRVETAALAARRAAARRAIAAE
jgi:5-methylcytosine-specific restriction endonuclease McrA